MDYTNYDDMKYAVSNFMLSLCLNVFEVTVQSSGYFLFNNTLIVHRFGNWMTPSFGTLSLVELYVYDMK